MVNGNRIADPAFGNGFDALRPYANGLIPLGKEVKKVAVGGPPRIPTRLVRGGNRNPGICINFRGGAEGRDMYLPAIQSAIGLECDPIPVRRHTTGSDGVVGVFEKFPALPGVQADG